MTRTKTTSKKVAVSKTEKENILKEFKKKLMDASEKNNKEEFIHLLEQVSETFDEETMLKITTEVSKEQKLKEQKLKEQKLKEQKLKEQKLKEQKLKTQKLINETNNLIDEMKKSGIEYNEEKMPFPIQSLNVYKKELKKARKNKNNDNVKYYSELVSKEFGQKVLERVDRELRGVNPELEPECGPNARRFELTKRCKSFEGLINNKSKLKKYAKDNKQEQLLNFAGQFGKDKKDKLEEILKEITEKKSKRKTKSSTDKSETDKKLTEIAKNLVQEITKLKGETEEMIAFKTKEFGKDYKNYVYEIPKKICQNQQIVNPTTGNCRNLRNLSVTERETLLKDFKNKDTETVLVVNDYNKRNKNDEFNLKNYFENGRKRRKSRDEEDEEDQVVAKKVTKSKVDAKKVTKPKVDAKKVTKSKVDAKKVTKSKVVDEEDQVIVKKVTKPKVVAKKVTKSKVVAKVSDNDNPFFSSPQEQQEQQEFDLSFSPKSPIRARDDSPLPADWSLS